ncbi:MAG: hypothetical protein ACXIVL_02595 [Oceanicaulis sp.]
MIGLTLLLLIAAAALFVLLQPHTRARNSAAEDAAREAVRRGLEPDAQERENPRDEESGSGAGPRS